jgi:AbrB family looped-hinge helix DNA binding protein
MKVTSKGQVTIPLGIRERCGITSGTEIDFAVRGDEVVITKKKEGDGQLEEWLRDFVGTGDTGLSTDEIMQMTRGED